MTEWSWAALTPVHPEIFLAIGVLLLLMHGAFRGNGSTKMILASVVALCGVAVFMIAGADWTTTTALGGMIIMDSFAAWSKILILCGLAVSLLLSYEWFRENNLVRFEYPLLALLSGIGLLLMVSANNLLALYVSLELSSLCLYVMAAIRRDTAASAEAGIKYFVLGALSSGLLLFGISLIYGYTGTIDYTFIQQTLSSQAEISVGAVLGLVFVLAGLAFKVSAVPFHMWTPDVYQGAPTPVTAFFAIVPKVAAIAMMMRLLIQPFGAVIDDWSQIIAFMAVASMVWGAFAAIAQQNIKRLLAYSSIANMGYALIGVLAAIPEGAAALLLYLAIYMVMTAGIFAIILCIKRNGQPVENISDLAGMSKTNPLMAYSLAALMFSISGIPPLAGFFSKLFIFQAAVASGHFTVAVIGVVASVVASYYYLRIIKVMFFDEADAVTDTSTPGMCRAIAIASVAFIVIFCAFPMDLLTISQNAASSLFP